MKKEDLMSLGFTKEQIKAIYKLNGKDINAVKDKLNTANETIKTLRMALSEFNGVDIESLKKDASEWKDKYINEMSNLKLNFILDIALMEAKARDIKAMKPFLNMKHIKLDGDKLLGFDEQIKSIKQNKSFLFEQQNKVNFKKGEIQTETEENKIKTGGALKVTFIMEE